MYGIGEIVIKKKFLKKESKKINKRNIYKKLILNMLMFLINGNELKILLSR